jgi:hypothetical protein
MKTNVVTLLLALLCTVLVSCSHLSVAGGTDTETGGGKLVGKVVTPNALPVAGTLVTLVPGGYNPFVAVPGRKVHVDTTDANGMYRFDSLPQGTYTIEFVAESQKSSFMLSGIVVGEHDSIAVPPSTLQMTASVVVTLPVNVDTLKGYVYIPGTTYGARITKTMRSIELSMLPAGHLPSIFYADNNVQTVPAMLTDTLHLTPGQHLIVSGNPWNYSQRITFNTTSSGAGVTPNVYHFPVLVRLTMTNFHFSQAQAHGEDIRFVKADNTSLAYEIERWDAVSGKAEIWVSLDTVYGNSNTQSIIMHWGNSAAADQSSGGSVFDTAYGFQGVWHLAEPGIASAYDATRNLFHGTPYGMTTTSSVQGVIGMGRWFNGVSSGFLMAGTANSRLDFKQYGTYTLSAWVNVDTFLVHDQHIVGKGNWQYSMRTKGDTCSPPKMFSFEEFIETQPVRWDRRLYPLSISTWKYITAVRQGTQAYLYIDGECVDSIGLVYYERAGDVRDTTEDVSIGRCFNGQTLLFRGTMDEVRISATAASAVWVKLCYMNQQENDRLVEFK